MAEGISLAKDLNDTNALAVALSFAGHYEHNPATVERVQEHIQNGHAPAPSSVGKTFFKFSE
jgi:hypothetical protein